MAVILIVFLAGMASLGLELTASRLLGNIFGTTNMVWANIIGLVLIYLTLGYFLGGRLADRSPHRSTFYTVAAWGAFTAGLIPIVARPVLYWAAAAVEGLNAAIMLGSFLAVLLLLGAPVTLMGAISPFGVRLSISDPARAGQAAGRVYGVSTLGSILGTFLPVLVLIPNIGTARTFLALALPLLLAALLGLWREDRRKGLRLLWMPLVLLLLAAFVLRGPIKRSPDQVFEGESAYNYIEVREVDGTRYLLLNEGQAVHSMYRPGSLATYGTWDYFLAAPYFNPAPFDPEQVERLGLVGLAAGTIPKQYAAVYGDIPIDGWEIDPEIVEVGQRWFDMNEPGLNVIVADGRWGLAHSDAVYTVLGVDAYRPPYIPWQLTTQEFFQEARDHLTADGVLVINVGRTPDDRRLIDVLVGTIGSVFPSVHVMDVPGTFNTMVYATVQPTSPENLARNLAHLEATQAHPFLIDVVRRTTENLVPTPRVTTVFTDDLAPVEQLVDSIVLRFFLGGDILKLQ
ncbi:MAG: fused MFS/spermidine synthase [Anaerolineales bacterium]|nr:fused MFS/spermidine synthase [Anaerolineales bacterium]